MNETATSSVWQVGLRVRGRVQGVFFRASTQAKAAELKLSGWVRNCADGSVQLEAFGCETGIRTLDAWIISGGPPAATVTNTVYEIPIREAIDGTVTASGFEVRRSTGS